MNLPESAVHVHPLAHAGLLLVAGYVGGYLANKVKAPRVTGYLLAGIAVGPPLMGLVPEAWVARDSRLVTDIALGIIAFLIGGSLALSKIRRVGAQIVVVTAVQAAGAFIVSTLAAAFFLTAVLKMPGGTAAHPDVLLAAALVLGAIATATAPAAVLAVVHEYRAQGPLTTMLLGVVALDDALAIFAFAFSVAVASSVVQQGDLSVTTVLFEPTFHLLVSSVLGVAAGLPLRYLVRFIPRRDAMLTVMIGSVFFISGLAKTLHASPILANMVFGLMVVNFVEHHFDAFDAVESVEEPIFVLFFALAGAHMNLAALRTTGILAVVISLARFAGKLAGSWLGARAAGSPETVRRYLGLALLPKAGVTVGLVLEASDVFAGTAIAALLVSGVIGSTIIDELFTPILLRTALVKAGEAGRSAKGPSP